MYYLFTGSDHGGYLLYSSAFTSQQTAIAVILSETLPATTNTGGCLTFWYIIRGSNLGRVEVTIYNSKGPVPVWSLGYVDQGESWQFASVGFYSDEDYNVSRSFLCSNTRFVFLLIVKIFIDGSISTQTQGYYAIDDIDIRDSYCGTTPANAAVDVLTTPAPATRPPASTQSLFCR